MLVVTVQLRTGTCLQCGQTREQVRRDETICGIEGGYEYRELEAEWDRHHWRDWSNRELEFYLRPEAFDRHRRTALTALPYVPCEDRLRGHNFSKVDRPFIRRGECWDCGALDLKSTHSETSGGSR